MAEGMIGKDGFARSFYVDYPLLEVDIDRAKIKSAGLTLPAAIARTRLKEWQHFLLVSPEVVVTVAIVDAKVMQVGWVQVVDKATGERIEHHCQRPMADVALARSLWDERSHWRSGGVSIEIHNNLTNGHHEMLLTADERGDLPALCGRFRCDHDLSSIQPMVVSMPVGRRRCAYSHKVALPAQGTLTVGDRSYEFEGDSSVAVLDIHKAHYPRHTFWKWATCADWVDGRLIAFNLTKNVIRNDETDNENAIWVDGKLRRIGPALFTRNGSSPESTWKVGSTDGSIELTFSPRGRRSENTNIPGVTRARFDQFYGVFSGAISVPGERIELKEVWGLCEDHDSVW